jgi:predicted Zn-dependent peptidase
MFQFALALALALAPVDSAVRVRTAEPGAIIVHRQPALPIVALRLSVLASDPPGYAGAAHLIQHLVFPTLQEQVRRVGGRAQMQRNADGVVYSVVGPAAELQYLTWALRGALQPRTPQVGELLVASHALEEERLAEWETAGSHVRSVLRSRLFPHELSAAGTDASAARIEASVIRDLWAEMYHPDRVSVVAVGDVRIQEVRDAFSDLAVSAAPARLDRALVDSVSAQPLAPAEATRGWLGLGYPASEMEPAALLVTARLLGDLLRERLPLAMAETEHWWTHRDQGLVAVVATPEPNLTAARRVVSSAITTLQRSLEPGKVRDAAVGARRDMLFYARTPEHMAELLGQFADRNGNPDAAQRFYSELERVSESDVQNVLAQLAARTPVRVDIPPQKLRSPS